MSHKTLAFGETCYRKGPSGDVVAEDGDGVSGSQALSLRVAEDAALVRAAAAAEDLVAETFLAAFRSARGYRGSGPVKAWLVGIARRKAADARRDRRPDVGLDEARQLVDPIRTDDVALRRIELARVVAMIGGLAPDRAEALRLRFFADLECGEIAIVMGRSEAAVKMLVHAHRSPRAIGGHDMTD